MNNLLNLYLLSQKEVDGYDTYDSCVVAAYSQEEAAKIYPHKDYYEECIWVEGLEEYDLWGQKVWASSPENVDCILIGTAADNIEPNTVICSSFNAG